MKRLITTAMSLKLARESTPREASSLQIKMGIAIVAVSNVVALAYLKLYHGRPEIPQHMLNNTVVFEHDILSPEAAASLRELMRSFREFPTNVNDLKFCAPPHPYAPSCGALPPSLSLPPPLSLPLADTTKHEHIGEARPIQVDGTCGHPFLVPSKSGVECVIPGRIDIGRHFIMSGGLQGLRESYEMMVSRVQSFGRYIFNVTDHPQVATLFDEDKFQQLARRVCPDDKQHLDPFQFNLIVQLPGQTVAAHVDGVYFWGATRFQLPQWLLAAMEFSGLFNERFVDQARARTLAMTRDGMCAVAPGIHVVAIRPSCHLRRCKS